MILAIRVQILGRALGIGEQGESSHRITAGIEKIDHGVTVRVKGETVVALHPSGETLVVSGLKVDEVTVSRLNDGVSS